eukprot:CAMPEP_0177794934 /NCGR_PEP_ID=MMETSP0491_2-20121128/25931_1 /TAXON_ID=63592 /ORGANISM="Tetraselmis chuii, Strain PLY429" /LENGTH=115 /DNA_ID=CAMNT_0019317665 /DNA_START=190 /DNA_END=537 /DNA_ORIENTATION=-
MSQMLGRLRLADSITAPVHSAARSAPANPSVALASASSSPLLGGQGQFVVWTARMAERSETPGSARQTSRSKRPGLRKPGSIPSGLFVAPITTTFPRSLTPSMRARRVVTTDAYI